MAAQTRAALKAFFETGDIPTEAQFADLIDSEPNIVDDLASSPANIIQVTKTISAAQILLLNGTPIEIIPAPAAGEFIEVLSASVNLQFNTTAYGVTTDIWLQCPGSVTPIMQGDNVLNASVAIIKPLLRTIVVIADEDVELIATKVEIFAPTANPTLGDSPMKIYAAYRIVTV